MRQVLPKNTSPYLIVRRSRIHSAGAFARCDILEGTKIIEYVGEKITKAEAIRRAGIPLGKNKENAEYGAVYIFELNNRHDIDGHVPYNTARYLNHSCDPNCETEIDRGEIWIKALRNIKKGEELTYNYNYGWDGEFEDHPCQCRTSRCVGYILNEEHWPKLKRKLKRQKQR